MATAKKEKQTVKEKQSVKEEPVKVVNDSHKWYVINSYAGHEKKSF
ncbi:MAG: hypothetical protein UZ20_WS6002001070 [candidate division WS6 bacterium OLB21]|uniref:Uncharacterized protein n=1 Tax=candidate division WS6 bacterium OLB21 TaxID=1617427 RepID=A0A136KEU6_9BACT|nr:MAG: hypothetical protein UZ20_WS6002001070 [candidate division WS6 bacterium OLB21]